MLSGSPGAQGLAIISTLDLAIDFFSSFHIPARNIVVMENTGIDDGDPSTNHKSEREDHQDTHQTRHQPADALPAKISLARAPTGPIPTRTWLFHLKMHDYVFEYENNIGQHNHCIRSRTADSSFRMAGVEMTGTPLPSVEGMTSSSGFPYPPFYRELVPSLGTIPSLQGAEVGGAGSAAGNVQLAEQSGAAPRRNRAGGDDHVTGNVQHTEVTQSWKLSWSAGSIFAAGIEREWRISHETRLQPVYVVVGVFPRGHVNPLERVVFVHKPKNLFWELFWAAFCLRGVTGTFFSLKHIKIQAVQGMCVWLCDLGNPRRR